MKAFLKVILSALALGLMAAAPALRAQDAPPEGRKGGGGKGGGRGGMLTIERIEEAVGALSADQKTKIADIIKKADIQNAAPEERREKMTALRASIAAVLTPEQKTKFDAMPQGGRGGPGGGGGGGKKKQN